MKHIFTAQGRDKIDFEDVINSIHLHNPEYYTKYFKGEENGIYTWILPSDKTDFLANEIKKWVDNLYNVFITISDSNSLHIIEKI
jgi:hypothetical protein